MEYLVYALWAFFAWCMFCTLFLLVWNPPSTPDACTVNRLSAITFAILSGVILELIGRF